MHIYKVPDRPDTIICMERDEFIKLVSDGVEFLKEREPRSGCPYFCDDIAGGHVHFSVRSKDDYQEILNNTRDGIREA